MIENSSPPIENFFPKGKDLGFFIQPKHKLLEDVRKQKAVDFIASELSKISTEPKYKNDLEYLKIACTFVENIIKKKYGLDKLEIIVAVFTKLFNLKDSEIEILKTSVRFLVDNKRIKKIKFIKRIENYIRTNVRNFF
jgi:hypothetical protein